jgi:hypothetical protein
VCSPQPRQFLSSYGRRPGVHAAPSRAGAYRCQRSRRRLDYFQLHAAAWRPGKRQAEPLLRDWKHQPRVWYLPIASAFTGLTRLAAGGPRYAGATAALASASSNASVAGARLGAGAGLGAGASLGAGAGPGAGAGSGAPAVRRLYSATGCAFAGVPPDIEIVVGLVFVPLLVNIPLYPSLQKISELNITEAIVLLEHLAGLLLRVSHIAVA